MRLGDVIRNTGLSMKTGLRAGYQAGLSGSRVTMANPILNASRQNDIMTLAFKVGRAGGSFVSKTIPAAAVWLKQGIAKLAGSIWRVIKVAAGYSWKYIKKASEWISNGYKKAGGIGGIADTAASNTFKGIGKGLKFIDKAYGTVANAAVKPVGTKDSKGKDYTVRGQRRATSERNLKVTVLKRGLEATTIAYGYKLLNSRQEGSK